MIANPTPNAFVCRNTAATVTYGETVYKRQRSHSHAYKPSNTSWQKQCSGTNRNSVDVGLNHSICYVMHEMKTTFILGKL